MDAKGPLGKAGFEVGDLILAIDDQPIAGVEDLINQLISLLEYKAVTLRALDHRSVNNGDMQAQSNAANAM